MVHSGSINGQAGGVDLGLTFVSDRTHAVASLANGNIQIMIHRRCLVDDGFGVGETLNDEDKISPHFRVFLDKSETSAYLRHRAQLLENYPPLPLFGNANSPADWAKSYTTTYTALTVPLPENVHLLSLELRNPAVTTNSITYARPLAYRRPSPSPTEGSPQNDTFVLLRLQHLYESGESKQYSVPISVNISSIFPTKIFSINSLQETVLTANLARSAVNRFTWNTGSSADEMKVTEVNKEAEHQLVGDFLVTLNPREIKTYRINSSPLTLN